MKPPRRIHSATVKARVALEAIRGEKTLAELATHYDVHPIRVTSWKKNNRRDPAGPCVRLPNPEKEYPACSLPWRAR